MSNNTISKIELPNGNVYDIVDAINLGKDDNGNIISSTYKMLQQTVANPTTNGETTAFIDTISQDAQGIITATKKNIPLVSSTTNGLMSIEDKTKLDGIDLTQYLPLSGGTLTGNLTLTVPSQPRRNPKFNTIYFSKTENTKTDYSEVDSSGTTIFQSEIIAYNGIWSAIQAENRNSYQVTYPEEGEISWTPTNLQFKLYSAAENSGTRLNYCEIYELPSATDNLTADQTYQILTTKPNSIIDTTAQANIRTNLGITPENIGAVAKAGDTMTGILQINDATPSSSASTGALVVGGGVGIGGNVNVSGALNVGDPATTRTNLGITPANIGAVANTDIIPISQGGTGGATSQNAKANLNLGTVTQNFIVNQPIGTNQAFGIGCIVDNSNYSARNGHRLTIIPKEESIGLYDSTQNEWVWDIPGSATVVTLDTNDTTAALIYPKLNKIKVGTLAMIYIQANAITALASKVTTSSFGIVYRMNDGNTFRFFVADVSVSTNGPYIHRFSSIVSASSIEPGSVAYEYSGTKL